MHRIMFAPNLLAIVWASLAPGLCLAGFLTHPCEPHQDAPCSHEADCQADPCNAVYLPTGPTVRGPEITELAALPPVAVFRAPEVPAGLTQPATRPPDTALGALANIILLL